MPRIAKIILTFMASMMLGFFVLLMVSLSWALVWMIMFLYLLLGTETRSGLTLLSWIIPYTHLVRTMDYDGQVRHVLAYGEWGQVLHGHLHWLSEMGEIQLYPNGYVEGLCYVYFWEPIHPEHLTCMHLTYDCVDLHKLKHMSWHAREEYRLTLKMQTKLNHESHI